MEQLDNSNSIHAFNRFEEKGYVERFQCHFRLVDILRDVFYVLVTPAIQEFFFLIYDLIEIIKRLMSTLLM